MIDLKKNIIPTKAFAEALGITQQELNEKMKDDSFSEEERKIIYNTLKNYPLIYPNIPLLDRYMRINNISLYDFRKKLQVQENFFYTFKAIALADEPQNEIIDMLRSGEPLNLNKLVNPLANAEVKKVLKQEGINFLQFRRMFLNDHLEYKRYLTSYSSVFLNLEYTEEVQDYMIEYIKNNI